MAPANLKRVISRWEIVGMPLNGVIGSGVYLLPAAILLGPVSLWAVPLAGLVALGAGVTVYYLRRREPGAAPPDG